MAGKLSFIVPFEEKGEILQSGPREFINKYTRPSLNKPLTAYKQYTPYKTHTPGFTHKRYQIQKQFSHKAIHSQIGNKRAFVEDNFYVFKHKLKRK
jgi:hypothetical protein